MKKFALAAVAAIGISAGSGVVASPLTDAYSSFWVFGDSLSDNGNLFAATGNPPPPYFNGRFSDGPVWNEAIIEEFATENGQAPLPNGFEGNLAYGGAKATDGPNANGPIPSITSQLGLFLGAGGGASVGSNPLASIWAGANDIFQAIDAGLDAETAASDAAAAVVDWIGSAAPTFANVLVFNLPDIGLTPRYFGTADQGTATGAAEEFNTQLAAELDMLELLVPTVDITRIDAFGIFADILANPSDYGVTNVENQCILTGAACDGFLLFDNVHPTALGHSIIEAAARDALAPAPVPLPAGLPLLLIGVTAFGVLRQRRAA